MGNDSDRSATENFEENLLATTSQLTLTIGQYSERGVKEENEDFVGSFTPENIHQLESKGIAIALADGVSSAEAGKVASKTAVEQFIEDYFQTPDTWSVSHAGQKILTSINLKLYRKSHEFIHEEKGYLCTFSGMVFKSRVGHIFHAGDSRIYQLEEGENFLRQITRDHVATLGKGRSILARAVGMDSSLAIDYSKISLKAGDIFFISTDGVHDFVAQEKIVDILASNVSEQEKAEALVAAAKVGNSDDNMSCIVVKVEQLPSESLNDYNAKLTRLPFPPELEPGMKIDGFVIKKEIFASSRSQLYLVEDEETAEQMVMKTPSVNYENDTSYIDRFIQEEWIGKRIDSPYVVKTLAQKRKRNFLYYIMEYVHGETLEKWMKKNRFPRPKVAIQIVEKIAEGIQAFHSQETIHQDLKPGNVMITPEGSVKIVDFGSVYVAGVAEVFRPIEHVGALGTASYSDPQYLMGKNSGVQGDLYALATIAYEIFTGELPYGPEIEECQSALDYDRLRYRSANQFNPVIPLWFDRTLERGVAFDLEKRYASMDKFLKDLHHPNPDYLLDDPTYKKDKSQALFWQVISGFWLITLLLVWFLFSN
ncbi:bifunctional protein-serine/threonine kinase/phosphatase [Aliikangiella sp. G2MR2-5]|uniref:bifunctional protein-serine/threonine kinase/phosphatase n=1 Tax=Aliikangiella sp. G2MR2-5 TaxID=2788943 RepID=UPI0018A89EE5|nr:bifunctional protein-serine/threonine kinase/phosphatase [Aliikangiella sp. G2MR2-5]